MSISRLYISAHEEFLDAAMAELQPHFPDAWMQPLGPDVIVFEDEGVSIATLADVIRDKQLVFPRHLLRGVAEISHEDVRDLSALGKAIHAAWHTFPVPDEVSLHVWQSGDAPTIVRNDVLRKHLSGLLGNEGIRVRRGGANHVLSVCIVSEGYIVGSNGVRNALFDWPGGRVQLAKPREQISRSEFKLEEIIRTNLTDIPTGGTALDLGAAPGGWSRILLNRGLNVWAVDTGKLHDSLHNRSGLTYIPTLAGPFLAENTQMFDLVVNDMRMEPALSANVMNSAAKFVPIGGMGIMSIKLPPGNPLPLLERTIRTLGTHWHVETVRQLFHNRHEVTAILRKR